MKNLTNGTKTMPAPTNDAALKRLLAAGWMYETDAADPETVFSEIAEKIKGGGIVSLTIDEARAARKFAREKFGSKFIVNQCTANIGETDTATVVIDNEGNSVRGRKAGERSRSGQSIFAEIVCDTFTDKDGVPISAWVSINTDENFDAVESGTLNIKVVQLGENKVFNIV